MGKVVNDSPIPQITQQTESPLENVLQGATFRQFARPDNAEILLVGRLKDGGAQVLDITSGNSASDGYLISSDEVSPHGTPGQRVTTRWRGQQAQTLEGSTSEARVAHLLRRAQMFSSDQKD